MMLKKNSLSRSKSYIFILSGLFAFFARTPNLWAQTELNCRISTADVLETQENCIRVDSTGKMKLRKDLLKKVQFGKSKVIPLLGEPEGCFWLDKKGNVLKVLCFDNGADEFREGLVRFITPSGKMGFANQNFKIVIPATYDYAAPFEYRSAYVCSGCKLEKTSDSEHGGMYKGGVWKIIDKNGRTLKNCPPGKDTTDCNKPSY